MPRFTPLSRALTMTLALAVPASAQDTRSLAEDYVELPAVQSMLDSMFGGETLAANLAASLPNNLAINESQVAAVATLMANEMSALEPVMRETMISNLADTFTAQELEAMIAFYGSEVGTAILTKNQAMMGRIMATIAPQMQQLQRGLTPQIMQILRDGQ